MPVIRLLSTFFLVQSFAGIHYSIGGFLNSTNPSSLDLVNEVFTLAALPGNHIKVIFK